MSQFIINISPLSGGRISPQARLAEVQEKISETVKAIRDLESNLILLLIFPELIEIPKDDSSDEKAENYKTIFRDRSYLTNPIEIKDKLQDLWGIKVDLQQSEYYILEIMEEYKKIQQQVE